MIDGRIWIELTLAIWLLIVLEFRGFVRSRIFLFIIWELLKMTVKKYGYRYIRNNCLARLTTGFFKN